MRRESLGKQGAQQIDLAREVVEEESLGHDGSASDEGSGCRVEAVRGKEVLRSVKNPFARLTAVPYLAGARRAGVRTQVLGDEGAGPPGTCRANPRHRNPPSSVRLACRRFGVACV